MFKKSTLLALAGALTLGVAMLSPVSADAKGFGGGHGGGHGGGGFHGGGMKFHGGGGFKGHGHGHVHFRPHFRPHWHVGYRRHYWIAPAVTYAVARPVAAIPGPCTCLSKEYTPEGAVLFKDRCTSEMAMNPPAAAPQQTSYAPAPVYQTAPVQAQPQQAYVPTYPGPAAAQPVQQ
jgi:hypothetical protein